MSNLNTATALLRPAQLLVIVLLSGTAQAQNPTLIANPTPNDFESFGSDVDDDVAIVSTPDDINGTLPDGTPRRSGAAHVLRLQTDRTWALEATLRPFGSAVAISGDVAVVSSFETTDHTNPNSGDDDTFGRVYVYRRTGGTWTLQQTLTPPPFSKLIYGLDVDVEGDRLVVGATQFFSGPPGPGGGRAAAPGASAPGASAAPGDGCIPFPSEENARADVYQDDGAAWALADSLVEPTEILGTRFGEVVSLSGDVVAVGASLWYDVDVCTGRDDDNDGTADGTERGRVYVYRATTPIDWRLDAELAPATLRDRDQFGFAAAVSGDLLVAGAPFRDGVATRSGAAYAYRYSGGVWTEEQEFVGEDTIDGDEFGAAVDLEGEFAVVGAPRYRNGEYNIGATYGFRRTGSVWTQGFQVTYDIDTDPETPGASNFLFGAAVALDGAHVPIGAPDDPRFGGPIGVAVGSALSYTLAQYFDLTVADEGGSRPRSVARGSHAQPGRYAGSDRVHARRAVRRPAVGPRRALARGGRARRRPVRARRAHGPVRRVGPAGGCVRDPPSDRGGGPQPARDVVR